MTTKDIKQKTSTIFQSTHNEVYPTWHRTYAWYTRIDVESDAFDNRRNTLILIVVEVYLDTMYMSFKYLIIVLPLLRYVKTLHGHFRDDFNVSIIHQSDEWGCFWVKIGSFIRNMTSSGLFTKKMTTFKPKFSSQHLVIHGL